MGALRSNQFIKKQARDFLSRLYRAYYEEKGKYLSPDEFFPVDLKKVISSVMNWRFESVSDIGYDSSGQRLRGQCDHDSKLIRFAFQAISPAEQNFTIAHEIGHAVLHASTYPPVPERKRTVPRITKLASTDSERKREREADIFAAELLMPEKAVRDRFFRIFGCKEMWLASTRAQQLIRSFVTKTQKQVPAMIHARDISPYFADYKRADSGPSMREFFGVSTSAMSVRLLELNLLFE